jgi:hypothetical protein
VLAIKPAGDTPRNVARSVNQLIRLTAGFTTTESHTTDFTLTADNTGGSFSNDGATALVTFHLPPAATDLTFTFVVNDADGIAIDADGTNTIRIGELISTAGGIATSTQVGSVLTLQGVNDSEWNATTVIGVWDLSGSVTSGETTQAQLDGKQPLDAELTAIAGLTSAADKLPYFTGSETAALADFTTAGRNLIDDASASDQRTTLGLGTIATQAANNVTISGGSISGITDLAVTDGGTGSSTQAGARSNLGLGTIAVENAGASGSFTTTDLKTVTVANGIITNIST